MGDQQMPQNFGLTAMAQAAAAMHEMFRSYVEAGFTEDQAIKLIITFMVASGQNGGTS